MERIFCLAFVLFFVCTWSMAEEPQNSFVPVTWSYDGQKLLLTQEDHEGVFYLDQNQGTCYQIMQGCGTGYKANWSYNNTKVAFKLLQKINDSITQTPAIFDTTTQKFIYLAPTGDTCGVPFFSKDGKIAFSINHEIYVLDSNYQLLCEVSAGHYANLCVISPDGNWVAYNNERDQIVIFSTKTLEKVQLTRDNYSYFSPIWSDDSSKILVSTVNGIIKVIALAETKVYTIGEGENPNWLNNTEIVYSKRVIEQEQVSNCDLYQSDYTGNVQKDMTQSLGYFETHAIAKAGNVAVYDEKSKKIYFAQTRDARPDFNISNMKQLAIPACVSVPIARDITPVFTPASRTGDVRSTTVISGVPYMHQVYDTPNWYSGHWACGATSAMMAIAYYKILPHWDCTVSVPYSHVSHYGRYVCEQYTHNGYTFNKMATDPNGKAAYGGYGFICQNNWENTKSHMATYFEKHGVSSWVDWSPTWDELKVKINNNHPMVILTSLTSAGHYILGVGYYNGQHTTVINDPYGNKNSGYMNYSGKGVSYDWPGYNNGFKNLNTVHCFIYAK